MSQRSSMHGRRHSAGFSLIELMIAVVVIAILLAVALPSFMDSIRKGRRSEAFAALSALQQAQERYRGNNASYATIVQLATVSPDATVSPTRPGGYYAISIGTPTATGYILTADGSGSSQASDGSCAKLSIEVAGGNIGYGSCASCTTFSYAASDGCWKR